MSAHSTKNLFRATKPKKKVDQRQSAIEGLHDQSAPEPSRDPLDYDPTPWSATRSLLRTEGDRIREIGGPVWEPAVGGGHMARELTHHGFDVIGSDVVDRGYPNTEIRSFYEYQKPLSKIMITNPPYCEVNARDGHGRWLKHIESLGIRYVAMLLNWDWMAARINGMDGLHESYPISRAYVCCWKIDFRGGGSPPQRNGWLIWDADWQGETVLRRLFKATADDQEKLI